MPFAKRDDQGRIVALTSEPQPGVDEPIDGTHPDVLAFLRVDDSATALLGRLASMDGHMARVTEDLIDVLVARGVLMFTDLPPAAQHKLLERQRLRQQREPGPGTFGAPDNDELI